MSVKTRTMEKKNEDLATPQKSTSPTINDVPLEVLELILKTLDSKLESWNTLCSYRRVSSTWRKIIDEHLQKKGLVGRMVGCSVAFVEKDAEWHSSPDPYVRCPLGILRHPGNPFPSRCLYINRKIRVFWAKEKRKCVLNLEIVARTFGTHLNNLGFGNMSITFEAIIKALKHLPNLKVLKFVATRVQLDFNADLESFPALPKLTTLELQSLFVNDTALESRRDPQNQFCPKLFNAYADQLVSLELELVLGYRVPLQQQNPSVENSLFQTLQQLKVCYPSVDFLQFSCVPPLKRLYLVGVASSVNVEDLIHFTDKFNNTLESLDLDVMWRDIFDYSCKQKAIRTGGILQTTTAFFPKLTKFSVAYPWNELEAAVIKKTFVVRFPALQELQLFYFTKNHSINYEPQVNPNKYDDMIREFIEREKYRDVSTTLKRVSVWSTGSTMLIGLGPEDNRLVYSYNLLPTLN